MPTAKERKGVQSVLTRISERISEGEWKTGQKIPSERQLEKELGVSRLTIHKSLSLLAAQGRLIRKRGSGTYVADASKDRQDRAKLLTYISPVASFFLPGVTNRGITEGLYDSQLARREKKGYHITVEFYRNPEEQREILRRISDESHAGFLVWYEPENQALLEQMVRSRYPVVILDAYDEQKIMDCVVTDNVAGSQMMVEYLASRGHTTIGYITRPLCRSSLVDRQSGFFQAIVQHGLPFDSRQVAVLDNFYAAAVEEIPEAVDRLRKQCPQMTAIYCGNDDLALAVISHLQSKGVRVPEEMSIAGFDNIIDWSSNMTVLLTTMEQDCYQIGNIAGHIIEERLGGDANRRPIREFVKPKLIVRSSVGDCAISS